MCGRIAALNFQPTIVSNKTVRRGATIWNSRMLNESNLFDRVIRIKLVGDSRFGFHLLPAFKTCHVSLWSRLAAESFSDQFIQVMFAGRTPTCLCASHDVADSRGSDFATSRGPPFRTPLFHHAATSISTCRHS